MILFIIFGIFFLNVIVYYGRSWSGAFGLRVQDNRLSYPTRIEIEQASWLGVPMRGYFGMFLIQVHFARGSLRSIFDLKLTTEVRLILHARFTWCTICLTIDEYRLPKTGEHEQTSKKETHRGQV